jgi:ribulose-5-phosphate 4-epimerase/fuculose-1-phosphate aldolase
MTIQETKQKLIDGGLVLAHQGQGDMTRGHVSIRVPGEAGLFFMKPHSVGLDEITMDNILTINLDG